MSDQPRSSGVVRSDSSDGTREAATGPTVTLPRSGNNADVAVGPHLTADQFGHGTDPAVAAHLASCRLCRRLSDVERRAPLPKDDLVTESAFRWPGQPMAVGGMAAVFKGDDKRLGRTVILKVPRQDDDLPAAMNEMFQVRLETEARVLARLQHPSIVTIYEVGRTTTGAPFCVLERVEGAPLRDRLDELAELEKDGPPRTRERLELVSNLVSIAEAMAYAHDRGIVHRDLNPNNIMIGKRGEATLIDWGIAKDTGHSAESLRMSIMSASTSGRAQTISAGTPPFVCFGQSQGYPADPSFDVYSFGMTLYECVAGTLPYVYEPGKTDDERQKNLLDFLKWAESGPPAAPAAPRDPELSGIIARAIVRDDDARCTADELLRALKQYLTGELVFSHRYSRSGRLSRWVRKHRGGTVAIGLAVAGAVAATVIFLGVRAREATFLKERAQLQAQAAAAQIDAANRQLTAEKAMGEAAQLLSRAEAAERGGQDAQQLRAAAEAKRKEAEGMAQSAAEAAAKAASDANLAREQSGEALAAAAAAEVARTDALKARDAAVADAAAAREAQRDAERRVADETTARQRAEEERGRSDEALRVADAARAAAVAELDAARAATAAAEDAKAAAERAVAVAESKLATLEARVRELEQAAGGGGGP